MGAKINEYPLERLTFGDDDFYDIDYWDGSVYQTAKIKGSTIKAGIQSAVNNLYNNDGTLAGNRQVTGANYELFFQELGKLIIHSHSNNIDNIEFEVRSQATFKSFNIKDHTTGNSLFSVENGKVKINGLYFLPTADGTSGQVITTDGSGNLSFTTISTSDTSIYTDNGVLTANRSLDGASGAYKLSLLALRELIVTATTNTVTPSISFYTLENNTRQGFVIYDQEEVEIFSTSDGFTRIHDAYNLPQNDGLSDRIVKTDGAESWGYGILRDNGNSLGYNSAPDATKAFTLVTNKDDGIVLFNAHTSGNNAKGLNIITNGNNSGSNVGIYGSASDSTTENIGGVFIASDTNAHALQLQDGTQGNGKVLQSDAVGKTQWVESTTLRQKDKIQVACSDETTVLSVASNVLTFRSPFSCLVTEVRASLTTAGSGGGETEVDITLNGATIFTNRLKIASGSTTSVGFSPPPVLNVAGFSDDDEIKISITDITNEPTETGLKVTFLVTHI